MKKANKLIKETRLKEVTDLMGKGYSSVEIASKLSREWICSERAVRKYISVAHQLLANHFSSQDLNDLLNQYYYLYKKAESKNQDGLATKILDSISKLTVATKVEVSGEIKIPDVIKIISTKKDTDD